MAKTNPAVATPAGSQTIIFDALPNQTRSAATITLAAVATSGLSVTFSVTGPATLNGGALTTIGPGSVTVTASQAGNRSWRAAPDVSQTFQVALEEGDVAFEAEGRLLQELGERLVANPDIALVELIKNSFDADALTCTVAVDTAAGALIVTDNGIGMTTIQFCQRWMRVATAHKSAEPISPRFGRQRTGQKGIGRFAVRFLGGDLVLTTIADDPKYKRRAKLEARFDWKAIDAAKSLADVKIHYTVVGVADDVPTGTTIRVGSLRHELDFIESKEFRTAVLRIISPLESLDRGRFRTARRDAYESDPGFQVVLPSTEGAGHEDLAAEVLSRAWAQLTIELANDKLKYTVRFKNGDKPRAITVPLHAKIKAGIVADIRYFPRRQGIFSGGSVNGRAAWSWVHENCGVAVIDHGFRLRPFGFPNDDWLYLDLDSTHNERDWRTPLAKAHFAIASEVRARPGDNPALNLPINWQLVGAVFLDSQASGNGYDLTVAMDREGFLDNEAYRQLVEVVRGGIEFLAYVDKQHLDEIEARKAAEAAALARKEFKSAIENIKSSPTLSEGDKNRLVTHYSGLSKRVEEVEEYGREARRKLETMGLLGVVAGYMTHEAAKILHGLERAVVRLRQLAARDMNLGDALSEVETGYRSFKSHVDYTNLFVGSMHQRDAAHFKAHAQVDHVLTTFGTFATDRGIVCANEIDSSAVVTGVPVAAYSGVFLNLYTNAIKAVLARQTRAAPPHILIRGGTEQGRHVIEVLDKGIGVPPELEERIFDPLFTTTSSGNNPLGSGMGLGLSLVKEVVGHAGGKLRLMAEPSSGFSTGFRVEYGVSK